MSTKEAIRLCFGMGLHPCASHFYFIDDSRKYICNKDLVQQDLKTELLNYLSFPISGVAYITIKISRFIGWGVYKPRGPKAEKLQEAQMPTVNYSSCSKGNSFFQPIDDESMLCAGFGGNSSVSGCNGDSGGPLVCQEGGKYVLRGAVSWGVPNCPAGNTFSVFTRVSSFIDWIEDHIKNSDMY